jgi:predicted ribosome quality control (RQC) complex YloA/Tae2 family protein
LERQLTGARDRLLRRREEMLAELSRGSRADRYERWGHLLMSATSDPAPGADRVEVADLFSGEGHVEIPLDPRYTRIENAGRLYEKARRVRQAREHAEGRLMETEAALDITERLVARLKGLATASEVEEFMKSEATHLKQVVRQAPGASSPFRRYALPEGYEVLVGRSAAENDLLTFRHAASDDLWLHARGVSGSHTLLRGPRRTAAPPRHVLEAAAGVAAFHSKARGSALVPVVVARRKHVRKPRGSALGVVAVEREQVLLVEPRLPS